MGAWFEPGLAGRDEQQLNTATGVISGTPTQSGSSYVDALGVVVPEVKRRLGQAKAGPEVGYAYSLGVARLSDAALTRSSVAWAFRESLAYPDPDAKRSR